jgi:hypothetical protein
VDLSEKKRSVRKKGKRQKESSMEVETEGSKIRWNSKYFTESTSHWLDK